METMLNRFDAMASEISKLSKQLEVTQESVDEVRLKQQEAATQKGGVQSAIPPVPDGGGTMPLGMARLTNGRPPVLPIPTGATVLPQQEIGERPVPGSSRREYHSAPSSPREYVAKPPKHDFPKFDGTNPHMWFDLCHTYFDMYSIQRHQWLSVASLYFGGHAALWWQAYKRCNTVTTWEMLCAAVVHEFGQDDYDVFMAKLHQLRQTGSVLEYRTQFETVMYQLISLDPSLNTKFFVSQFVLGLKDELRAAVRLQAPTSVTRAVSLARIQEEELELHRPRTRSFPAVKVSGQFQSGPAVSQSSAPNLKRAPIDDYGRERQLRDYRWANDLCFRCGDKFSKEHQCKKPLQLLTIQLGEFGEVFTEDTVQALELLSEPVSGDAAVQCCHISLQAVSGGEANETICLRAQVGNQIMITLIDSGSSHSFINQEFALLAKCPITSAPVAQVKLANGSLVLCDQQVSALEWMTQGYTFSTTMRVLELGGYDAVLGMDWLKSCSPMTVDWIAKTLIVPHNGSEAHLVGIQPMEPANMSLNTITVEQLRKAYTGNDIYGH
jgi:hypothetical protein